MNKWLLYATAIVCGLAFGCSLFAVNTPNASVIGPAAPTSKPPVAGPKTVAELEKEVAEAKAELEKAKATVKAKEKELASARLLSRQKKLWWIAGICGVAVLGCIAGSIFLPGAARWFLTGGAASAAVGLTCWLVAEILPYMPYILIGFGAIAIGTLIWLWRRDHKGLRQVVSAVESVKGEIPEYKDKLKKFVNGGTDKYVNKVREKLGLKKKG